MLLLLLALALTAAPGEAGTRRIRIPAFPGAAGHGAEASGGRGGRVVEVTNLNDSGPGSLRAALLETGTRTVVFRTGGVITLDSQIVMGPTNGDVTIAGQTAPGGGIVLRGNPLLPDTLIRIEGASDIVLRYLRLRGGVGVPDGTGKDNLRIEYGHDIIVDHVSFSWSSDENIDLWNDSSDLLARVTVQRSIIAEGLDGHSTGAEVSGYANYTVWPWIEEWRNVRSISLHRNLFQTNAYRNPRVNALFGEAVNNVVYNWGYRVLEMKYGGWLDWVNNYVKEGPWLASNPAEEVATKLMMYQDRDDPPLGTPLPLVPSIYTTGTIVAPRLKPDPDTDDWPFWTLMRITPTQGLPTEWRRLEPQPPAAHPVPVLDTELVFADVLNDAGANARLDCNGVFVANSDLEDLRLLGEAWNGTGATDARSGGGLVYQNLDPGTPCADADADGMADAWEEGHSFSPADPSDRNGDRDHDGYTNLEEYLNGTAP